MSTRFAYAAVLLAGLALATDTALAQGRRYPGGQGSQGQGRQAQGGQGQGRSAEPRGGARDERAIGSRRAEGGNRPGRADDGSGRRTPRRPAIDRADGQPRAQVQRRTAAQPGIGYQPPLEGRSLSDNRSGWGGQHGDTSRRAVLRPDPYPQQYQSYGGYNSYPRRSYVMPYGYRPYGYRPGWSFHLYFGRPYRLPIYGNTGYGYYAIDAGFVYGSLQIVDAPPFAQVFVDGYYAGEVDEFDRVFQQLNLTPGPHHIEIVVDEAAPPIEFDVRIIPGETVTYRVRY